MSPQAAYRLAVDALSRDDPDEAISILTQVLLDEHRVNFVFAWSSDGWNESDREGRPYQLLIDLMEKCGTPGGKDLEQMVREKQKSLKRSFEEQRDQSLAEVRKYAVEMRTKASHEAQSREAANGGGDGGNRRRRSSSNSDRGGSKTKKRHGKGKKKKKKKKKNASRNCNGGVPTRAVVAIDEGMADMNLEDSDEGQVEAKEAGGGATGGLQKEPGGVGCDEVEGEEEEECTICTMVLNQGENEVEDAIKTLICGHRFHGATCLIPWKAKCREKQLPPTCPTCRGPLIEAEDEQA